MPKTYLLPEDVRGELLGYLMDRPYREVARAVQVLASLQEFPEPLPAGMESTSATRPASPPVLVKG